MAVRIKKEEENTMALGAEATVVATASAAASATVPPPGGSSGTKPGPRSSPIAGNGLGAATTTFSTEKDTVTKQLRVEDALLYLDDVKRKLKDRPAIFNEFLAIMTNSKTQEVDTPRSDCAGEQAVRGYNNLILGFNTFLPDGFKISSGRSRRAEAQCGSAGVAAAAAVAQGQEAGAEQDAQAETAAAAAAAAAARVHAGAGVADADAGSNTTAAAAAAVVPARHASTGSFGAKTTWSTTAWALSATAATTTTASSPPGRRV